MHNLNLQFLHFRIFFFFFFLIYIFESFLFFFFYDKIKSTQKEKNSNIVLLRTIFCGLKRPQKRKPCFTGAKDTDFPFSFFGFCLIPFSFFSFFYSLL